MSAHETDVKQILDLSRELYPKIVAKQLTNEQLTSFERELYVAVQRQDREELVKLASRYAAGER